MRIDITENGPLIVRGSVPLLRLEIVTDEAGTAIDYREVYRYPLQETYALCRCGASKKKPFCDGRHTKSGFDGTETAGHRDFVEDAQALPGVGITLLDAQRYCMGAGFCHQGRGVWEETRASADPDSAGAARNMAAQCPSHRLAMFVDELGVERPELELSIALLEVPHQGVSSALWVRGGIPIFGADGQPYEVRDRVTLCRCGASRMKPYCDGAHILNGFDDGLSKS
jgi:CDGSH-type Zn-finger protein